LGDYGIVGILSVELGPQVKLSDFVVSCRIARQHVESAWLHWLFNMLQTIGYHTILAHFIPTARNAVLLQTLEELGFSRVGEDAGDIVLRRSVTEPVPFADIVTVEGERVRATEKTGTAVGAL
jgi:predicted enzyme involved in methoxymalonyl-ACP biosynthesis